MPDQPNDTEAEVTNPGVVIPAAGWKGATISIPIGALLALAGLGLGAGGGISLGQDTDLAQLESKMVKLENSLEKCQVEQAATTRQLDRMSYVLEEVHTIVQAAHPRNR